MEGPFLSHSLSQQIFQVRVQVRVYHHPSSYSTPLSRCLSIWNTGKHIDGSLLTLGTAHVGVHIQDVYVRRHWTVERETDGPIVVHAAAFLRWMGAEGDLGHGDASAAGDLAAVLVSLAEDGLPMLKIEVVITLDAASCEPNPQSVVMISEGKEFIGLSVNKYCTETRIKQPTQNNGTYLLDWVGSGRQ
mmetsp:Transcript_28565/g.82680  ORF Transcript_28565/g.82680 Transcript_28565/m.82680 type:complete len:189 (-) Transcript_28565:946-1512(-)